MNHPPPIGHRVILGPRGNMPKSEGNCQTRVEGLCKLVCILLGDPRTHSGYQLVEHLGGHPQEVLERCLVFITEFHK